MKAGRSWCLGLIILIGGVLGLLLAGVLYYYYTFAGPRALNERRLLEGPPSILVYSPRPGDSVPAGSVLQAQAIVSGRRPIERVEIWLDAELAGTQTPTSADQATFNASFDLQISEGAHVLSWRAVDRAGLVGQSQLITIAGERVAEDKAAAPGVPPAAAGQGGEGQGGESIGGQPVQPAAVNAPSPPQPEAPQGTASLLPANIPALNLTPLVSGLLSAFPAAPSHLQAGFERCTVRLVWNDNASNEDGFRVWMQSLGGPPIIIQTTRPNPGTGQTMFEFASPSFGIYSFWVEAFTGLGGQPSEIAWVAINDANCGEGVASQLEIEGLGMRVTGSWRDIYCYLSVEGAPEKRIPEGGGYLEQDAAGAVNVYEWIGAKNRILLRIPADEEVTLAGDCWGWPGALPGSMGEFTVSVPKEEWDSRTLQIRGTNYVIDYRIRPFGSTQAEGAFTYVDYGIPRPEFRSLEVKRSDDPIQDAELGRIPIVTWAWNGDAAGITSFGVFVNGTMMATPGSRERQSQLLLPSSCGGSYRIEVAALSGAARSPFSEGVTYSQPPCPVVAEVQFLTARSDITDDYSWIPVPGRCDVLGVYYRLWAVNTVRKDIRVGTTQVPLHYQCNIDYDFTNQLGAPTATIVVPIDPQFPELRIGTEFWESDDWGDDRFGVTFAALPYTYAQWPTVDEDVILSAGWMDGTADLRVKAHVRGYFYPGP